VRGDGFRLYSQRLVLRIEQTPQFTRDVVARGLLERPFTVLDIGARGGLAEHWQAFAGQLEVLAVEPDPSEPGVNAVLGAAKGMQPFFHRTIAALDGLYDTRALYRGTVNEAIVETTTTERVEVTTLDAVFDDDTLGRVDFVKLDVELAELDVLRGSGPLLDAALAVEIEVHFPKRPRDAGCFAEVDLFLQERGFELYDLETYRYSRPAFPAPRLYDYRLPSGEPDPLGAHAEGQILSGDALYLTVRRPISIDRLLKLACICELYRLRDCAVELLEQAATPTGGDLALLRRPHDALRDKDGNPWGPNFQIFEDLWRNRPPTYPEPPPPPSPPRFRDAVRDLLRRRLPRPSN